VNQDGTSNGITAPSAKSQERLETAVYATHGIDPADIDLVEAHGTGTKLGDPIEFAALDRAFRAYTDKTGYCAIGSIKTNIGHTATAAGTAGLIKVLLSLRHEAIPPSLHFERGNSHIDFDNSPFYVNTVHRAWPRTTGKPRLAAVSSFGFSGTNAHVVVAEAPHTERAVRRVPAHLVVLSALSREQLGEQAERLLAHLRGNRDLAIGDVALTLLQGRRRCPVRLALVVRDIGELTDHLSSWLAGAEGGVRVADLSEDAPRSQAALARVGENCLRQCADGVDDAEYVRSLEVVRDLFLDGCELDYDLLFAGGGYGRVPLPTYPFARQRHWISEEHQVLTAALAPVLPEAAAPVERGTGGPVAEHVALAPYWVRDTGWDTGALAPTGPVLVIGADTAGLARITGQFPTARVLTAADLSEAEAALRRERDVAHVVWFAPSADGADTAGLPARVDAGACALFAHVKVLLELGCGGREMGMTVVTRQTQSVLDGEPVHPADAAVLGLAGVVANEYPDWTVRALDVGTADEVPAAALFGVGGVRALRNGQWFRRRLANAELPAQGPDPYRRGGVYVVLGGAGGLGEVWTEDVVRRFQAQVVWIGRRAEDAVIRAKLDRLGGLGPRPVYLSADAADAAELTAAYREVKDRFGVVDGVVQSVFGVVDQSLANTTPEQFRRGLEAKVAASVQMALVFGAEPLDFMLFFSSIASFSHTMGYCSYVAGNMFEDALAHRLGAERPYPVKVVNWGYWGAVGSGVGVPAHVRGRLYQQGFGDIDPALGMAAVQRLLAAPVTQLAYLSIVDPGQFDDYTAVETVRVHQPAGRPAEAITPRLPSRDAAVDSAMTRVKFELRALDAVLAKALAAALQRAGWLDRPVDAAGLKQRHGVLDKYERWLDECLRSLAEHGHLVPTASGSYTAVPVDIDAVAAQWADRRDGWLDNPDVLASAKLADRVMPVLTDIVTGRTPAVDVIFPDSSLEFVEGVYKYNTVADHFNGVVGDCVLALLRRRLEHDPASRVRVLEIGAGTGGTTATVLRRLRPHADHVDEYCYTDLSRAFLIHGAQQFGPEAPYLRCEILDVSEPVAAQGFDECGYDLIIATNVLHATKDIRTCLRNAKALLRPGGAIVVNEIAGYTVFGLLTFGLLDGWWLYDDVELREKGGPGLTPQMWSSVLRWEGFTGVEFPARDAHVLGQQVIVGFSDGVVRQGKGDDSGAVADPQAPTATSARAEAGPVDDASLRTGITTHVRTVVAKTLMLPVESVGIREPLSAYGIDSILILQLTNTLKKDLGELDSTLFFEFRTIEALAEHFVAAKRDFVAALVAPESAVEQPPAAQVKLAAAEPANPVPVGLVPVRTEPVAGALADAIAVIGVSARFPQAPDLDVYWANLRSGKDCVTEVPADRWPMESFYEPDRERAAATGRSYAKWGGFLDGFADFDPLFFEIPPAEAVEMDPQERLFLQEAWKAFEDAGYTRARLAREFNGVVGVFVGVTRVGHNLFGPPRWQAGDTAYPFTSFASVANRVSFKLNLAGPSMPIDTMCSSSLTALHEACEHLLRGECEVALTGGVNLYLHPSSFVNLSNLGMLSDDGKCRSFGSGGNGFVPGEGVGALVLKRLGDAERDGDHIHAVIRGTAVNHGGATNGYTVPNPVAQGKVVRRALERAGVDARTVGYIEAHGTGTALGDPIEISGLTKAFAQDTSDTQFCAIGSSKSNIGHAEAAAGIAGVCKVLLQLRHRELAPTLHAAELNPHIDFAATPFLVQRDLAPWRPVLGADGRELPRRAGVSSFGAGGANAHVVIEEYVSADRVREPVDGPAMVVLSAKDADRLVERAGALVDWLTDERNQSVPLRDIAYTLHIGRESMTDRLGVVVGSTAELLDRLREFMRRPDAATDVHRGRVRWDDRGLSALTADEDMAEVVRTWVANGKHDKVLELWVGGMEVDWAPLYAGTAPAIVRLPTYPFARERHWIGDRDITAASPDAANTGALIDAVLDDYLDDSLDGEAAVQRLRISLGAAGSHPSKNGSR
jgi:acyl transferase domain-containing protein/SAM-dependent methyltransferase/acyl carrier protein